MELRVLEAAQRVQGCLSTATIAFPPGNQYLNGPIRIDARTFRAKDSIVIDGRGAEMHRGGMSGGKWLCGPISCSTRVLHRPSAVWIDGVHWDRERIDFGRSIPFVEFPEGDSLPGDRIDIQGEDSLVAMIGSRLGPASRLLGVNGVRPHPSMPLGAWNGHELPILSGSRTSRNFSFRMPGGAILRSSDRASGMLMKSLHGIALPRSPPSPRRWTLSAAAHGGWWIVAGASVAPRTLAWIPESDEGLMELVGGEDSLAAQLIVKNFRFMYSGASVPSVGIRGMQVAMYSEDQSRIEFPAPAIHVRSGWRITLRDLDVQNVAGTGILLDASTRDVEIRSSKFQGIGGTAIVVGGARLHPWEWPQEPGAVARSINIVRNTIRGTGKIFPGQAGVMISAGQRIRIEENRIDSTTFASISVGWGWGRDNQTHSVQILRNALTHSCMAMWDCGAIYLLGPLGAKSLVRGNSISGWSGAAAIYQDHAASLRVDSNWIRTPGPSGYGSWIYQQRSGIPVEGSRIVANFCEAPFGASGSFPEKNQVESCQIR